MASSQDSITWSSSVGHLSNSIKPRYQGNTAHAADIDRRRDRSASLFSEEDDAEATKDGVAFRPAFGSAQAALLLGMYSRCSALTQRVWMSQDEILAASIPFYASQAVPLPNGGEAESELIPGRLCHGSLADILRIRSHDSRDPCNTAVASSGLLWSGMSTLLLKSLVYQWDNASSSRRYAFTWAGFQTAEECSCSAGLGKLQLQVCDVKVRWQPPLDPRPVRSPAVAPFAVSAFVSERKRKISETDAELEAGLTFSWRSLAEPTPPSLSDKVGGKTAFQGRPLAKKFANGSFAAFYKEAPTAAPSSAVDGMFKFNLWCPHLIAAFG